MRALTIPGGPPLAGGGYAINVPPTSSCSTGAIAAASAGERPDERQGDARACGLQP